MSTRDAILKYLSEHDKVTSPEIAQGVGRPTTTVQPALTYLYREGRITRTCENITLIHGNGPRYRYGLLPGPLVKTGNLHESGQSKPKQGKPKQPRIKQDNPAHGDKVDTVLCGMFDQIATDIAQQIVGKVKERIAVELMRLTPTPPEAPVTPVSLESVTNGIAKPSVDALRSRGEATTLPAPRLLRILVTGLLPQQAGMIQSEFNDCFDIRFWNNQNGDGFDSLKSLCKSSDAVFFHTSHSSHGVESAARQHAVRFIRVPGGMTQMRAALTEFYAEAA